jgi:hypothetical protein
MLRMPFPLPFPHSTPSQTPSQTPSRSPYTGLAPNEYRIPLRRPGIPRRGSTRTMSSPQAPCSPPLAVRTIQPSAPSHASILHRQFISTLLGRDSSFPFSPSEHPLSNQASFPHSTNPPNVHARSLPHQTHPSYPLPSHPPSAHHTVLHRLGLPSRFALRSSPFALRVTPPDSRLLLNHLSWPAPFLSPGPNTRPSQKPHFSSKTAEGRKTGGALENRKGTEKGRGRRAKGSGEAPLSVRLRSGIASFSIHLPVLLRPIPAQQAPTERCDNRGLRPFDSGPHALAGPSPDMPPSHPLRLEGVSHAAWAMPHGPRRLSPSTVARLPDHPDHPGRPGHPGPPHCRSNTSAPRPSLTPSTPRLVSITERLHPGQPTHPLLPSPTRHLTPSFH